MIDYKDLLPTRLASAGYQAQNGELAWPRLEALEVIECLSARHIAILGGEVWLPTVPGPTLPPPNLYVWDAGSRRMDETWAQYVERTTERAREFVREFKWNEGDQLRYGPAPYFNLTVCDETDHGKLASQLESIRLGDWDGRDSR